MVTEAGRNDKVRKRKRRPTQNDAQARDSTIIRRPEHPQHSDPISTSTSFSNAPSTPFISPDPPSAAPRLSLITNIPREQSAMSAESLTSFYGQLSASNTGLSSTPSSLSLRSPFGYSPHELNAAESWTAPHPARSPARSPIQGLAISSLSRYEGPVSGGPTITICGFGFDENEPLWAHFGFNVVITNYRGPNSLSCCLPPAPGPGPVVVALSRTGNPDDLPSFTGPSQAVVFMYLSQNDDRRYGCLASCASTTLKVFRQTYQ